MHGTVAIPLDDVFRHNRSTRRSGSDKAPSFLQISIHLDTYKYSFILQTVVN